MASTSPPNPVKATKVLRDGEPKPVRGFLTTDGNFFEHKPLAELHEAEMQIRALCVSHTPRPIDPEKFLSLIEAMADPIKAYQNAFKKCQDKELTINRNATGSTEPSGDQANDGE